MINWCYNCYMIISILKMTWATYLFKTPRLFKTLEYYTSYTVVQNKESLSKRWPSKLTNLINIWIMIYFILNYFLDFLDFTMFYSNVKVYKWILFGVKEHWKSIWKRKNTKSLHKSPAITHWIWNVIHFPEFIFQNIECYEK